MGFYAFPEIHERLLLLKPDLANGMQEKLKKSSFPQCPIF